MAAVLAVALLLALAAVSPAAAEAPRVLVTGDSMAQPLDSELVRPVRRRGGRVVRDARPGTGLTGAVGFDWLQHARRQMRRHRPAATVMFIGAHDFGPLRDEDGREVDCCRRAWIDAYARRVRRLMGIYHRRGRGRVYWLTHPAPRDPDRARRLAAINAAIAQAAGAAPTGVRVIDTVPALTPGYRFRRKMRYRGRSVVVRDVDGVHLTVYGARVVRDLVMRALRADGVLQG